MPDNSINGFGIDQIFHLYSFLVAYEGVRIQNYQSNKKMFVEHPELSSIEYILKKIKFYEADVEKMKTIDADSLCNTLYQKKIKKTHLLSFLSHLRNSIAHGSIKEKNDAVIFSDSVKKNITSSNINTLGCVDLEIIKEITKILKNTNL